MKSPQAGDIVEVDWLDSEHIQMGWQHPDKYREAADQPQAYSSAGYWIDGSRDHALVALSVDAANHTVSHAMSIPKVAITGVRVLSRSRKIASALR